MRCSKCARMLGLYAGGDLPAKDVGKVEEHLAACEACRKLLEDLRAGIGVLRESACTEEMLPAEDPSYWQEVESKLRGRALAMESLSSRGSWRAWLPRIAAQAAVVLVVAGVVVWLATLERQPAGGTAEAPTVRFESREAPIVYYLRRRSPYRLAEVMAPPIGDNEVQYGDTGVVVSPREIREYTQQILPASAEEVPERF